MTDHSIKMRPRAYHPETAMVLNRLPMHDVVRRRRDGSAHQLLNIAIGKGLRDAHKLLNDFVGSLHLNSCPVTEPDIVYEAPGIERRRGQVTPPNLVRNSAFEYVDLIDQLPYHWVLSSHCTLSNDSYFGKNSIQLTVPPGEEGFIMQRLELPGITHLDPMCLSIWAKSNGVGNLQFALVGTNRVNNGVASIGGTTTGFTSWRREYFGGTFGVPTGGIHVYIKVSNTGATNAVWTIDAIQAELNEAPTVWRPKLDDQSPYVDNGGVGEYEISFRNLTQHIVLEYAATNHDFFYYAVPQRATIQTGGNYVAAETYYGSKIDFWDREWLTRFAIQSNKIVKVNDEVPDEVLGSYDLTTRSRYYYVTWAYPDAEKAKIAEWVKSPIIPLQLTMLRSLLYVLAWVDDHYEILVVNPDWEEPENNNLYLLNRITIQDDDDVLTASGATLTLGRDDEDQDSLTIRVEVGDATTDYKVKLWYDYYTLDDTASRIYMREDYSVYGGVTIR